MTAVVQQEPSPAISPRELHLNGLDGTNPLGFLAALGLFRILDDRETAGVRMRWTPAGGTWAPALRWPDGRAVDQEMIINTLTEQLAQSVDDHPAKLLAELEGVSTEPEARRKLFQTIASETDRTRMDWLCAFASDAAAPDAINQLQTTRRDYVYRNIESVIARTKSEHLRRAIFSPWDYSDALDNQSLHLDPSEDRRHAYQWNKPAGDPERKDRGGMLGANRLALEAISLFPSFPESNSLHTLGFTGNRSTNTRWTWPLWSASASLRAMQSLLSLAILQKERLEPEDVASIGSRGIVAVYRTRRILVGKTPNFTPAECIARPALRRYDQKLDS